VMEVHAAKEYDDTPRESRQQWTSLDEGKGEIKKQPPHHLHGHPAHALVTVLIVVFTRSIRIVNNTNHETR
jgi:hypothetical protein